MIDRLRGWARRLKRDALVVWLAARHPGVPLLAKIIAGLVAAYAFSPLDLIPDFIPILGLLDDLILVPAGIWLVFRMIPEAVRQSLRAEAEKVAEKPVSRVGAALVLIVWGAVALLVWRWLA